MRYNDCIEYTEFAAAKGQTGAEYGNDIEMVRE